MGVAEGCFQLQTLEALTIGGYWWSDEGKPRSFGNFPKMPRCHAANDEVKSSRWWWWRTSNLWRASTQSCRKFGTSMWLVLEDISVLITTWPHEVGLKIVILSGHPKLLDKKYRRKQKLWFFHIFCLFVETGLFFPRRFLQSAESSCDWGIATFELRVLVNLIMRLNFHHRKRQDQGTEFQAFRNIKISSHQSSNPKKTEKKGYQLTQPPCWIGPQFKSYQNIIQSLLQVMALLLRLQTSPWVPMAPACVHMPNGVETLLCFETCWKLIWMDPCLFSHIHINYLHDL